MRAAPARRPLKPRTWRVTVTHEVRLPVDSWCTTGSPHQQPYTGALQPWSAAEWDRATGVLGALDAPTHIPTGGASTFEFASSDGSTVYHCIEHCDRRAGALR